jgi:hypothetical protein
LAKGTAAAAAKLATLLVGLLVVQTAYVQDNMMMLKAKVNKAAAMVYSTGSGLLFHRDS